MNYQVNLANTQKIESTIYVEPLIAVAAGYRQQF